MMQLRKDAAPIFVNPLCQPGEGWDKAVVINRRLHGIGQSLLADTQKFCDQQSKAAQSPLAVIVQSLLCKMVLCIRIMAVHCRHDQAVL